MSRRSTLASLALVLALGGCSAMGVRPPWLPSGTQLEGQPDMGVPYQVKVYTHCGLFFVRFDGSDWAISGDLSDGSGNPPPGFNNPFDTGTVTLTSRNEAVWTSEFGERRTLTRDGSHPTPGICM